MDLRGNRRISFVGTAGAVVIGGLAGLVAACANTGPGDAIEQITEVDYGEPYLGMSKQEVFRCAGQPRSRISASQTTETLIYRYNGAGPVPQPAGDNKKDKGGFNCTASLTFEKDTLVRVSYAHVDVRSPYAWQSEDNPEKAAQMRSEGVPTCPFSLPRCPR